LRAGYFLALCLCENHLILNPHRFFLKPLQNKTQISHFLFRLQSLLHFLVIFLLIFRNEIYKLITDKEYRKTFDITESFVSFTQGNETADAEKTIVACNNFNTFRWAGGGF
jgi:hypothetical protein